MSLLSDLVVTEASSDVAVRYCGKLFAAHGATVLRLAPPPGATPSPFDLWLDHGKSPAQGALASRLSDATKPVDVVLAGLDKTKVRRAADEVASAPGTNPLFVSLTWFGERGPYADWVGNDAVIQAMSGAAYAFGEAKGPPILAQGHAPQLVAGATAYIAALAALIGRRNGGGASRVDVNVLEAYLCFTETSAAGFAIGGPASTRRGVNRFAPTYPAASYETREGWIGVTALTPQQWQSLCELVGLPELARDPRLSTAQSRLEHADLVDAALAPAFRARTAAEWLKLGQGRRIPLAPLPTPRDLLSTPHWLERTSFASFGPRTQAFQGPAMPFRILPTGGKAPAAVRPATDRPLAGLRVLDLSMGWAGPLATRHLADLGAEVIKVESCTHMDWWRGWEILQGGDPPPHEVRPSFVVTNRNKRGITIDLRQQQGIDLVQRFAARAHILVENFAPGVLDRLGLSAKSLTAANPGLVYMSMGAFGSTGPWRDFRAYGSTTEQASGLPFINGKAEWPPCLQHVAYGDAAGGLYGAAAALTALYAQAGQGGAIIDLSQVECLFQLGAEGIVAAAAAGANPARRGSRRVGVVPCGCFPSAEPDQWIAIAAETEDQRAKLKQILELSALAISPHNVLTESDWEEMVAAWTSTRPASEAVRSLQAAGIPAGAVAPAHCLQSDPHLVVAGFWPSIERRYVGPHIVPAPPYLIDGKRPEVRRPAPTLGEHNEEVITSVLGLSASQIAALHDSAVIGTTPKVA